MLHLDFYDETGYKKLSRDKQLEEHGGPGQPAGVKKDGHVNINAQANHFSNANCFRDPVLARRLSAQGLP